MRFLSHRVEAADIKIVAEAVVASEGLEFKDREVLNSAVDRAIFAITENLRCDPAFAVFPLNEDDIADLMTMEKIGCPQNLKDLKVLSPRDIISSYASGVSAEVVDFLGRALVLNQLVEEVEDADGGNMLPAFMIPKGGAGARITR